MSRDLAETTELQTADGETLEAEVLVPVGAAVGVVITHPHPIYGGSMHTPVPDTLFRRAAEIGVGALRFNFRSVGASTGAHDSGRAERLDVAAALDEMATQVPGPIVLAGWSFGADVAMAVDHDRLAGWLAVAAPLAVVPVDEMVAPSAAKPKLLLVPQHDQFREPAAAHEVVADWVDTTVEVIPATDHFLAGGLGVVSDAFARFVEGTP